VKQDPKHNVRMEYASWLATPKRLKSSLNLPVTKQAFSEMKGVNVRTLSRWEKQPDFEKLVEQRRIQVSGMAPNATVAAVGPPRPAKHGNALKKFEHLEPVTAKDDPVYDVGLTPDELRYQQVKDTLLSLATDGNQQAIDLYMKHYGKPFVEAEQRSAKLFPTMSDEELATEVIRLIGKERLKTLLAA
jgi:hypothetical protein